MNMTLKELGNLSIEVLKDWRVIVGALVFIIFSSLSGYVIRYRKKLRPKKAKVKPTPAPKPAKKEATEEDEEEGKA